MAKKDDHDLPDLSDFDDLGFGDADFDSFGDLSGSSKKKKGDRTPYHAAAQAFLKTSKDRLIDRGFVRRMLSGVLPKGYTQALNTYDALDRGVADILKDNKSELDPYLRKLKGNSDRAASSLLKFLPKSVRDAIGDSDAAPSYGGSRQSELDGNLSGLGEIFKAQAAERMQDTYAEAARDIRDQKRFALEMQVSSSIGRGIGRLVGYQDNILIKYHQKNLEIGYRQLDVNMKMFALQREYFTKSQQSLEHILENTALPDFVKMTHVDVVKQQLSSKLANGALNTVNKFTSNYFGGLKNNISEGIGAGLNVFSQIKSMEGPGMTRGQMVGDMAGQFAGDAAASGVEYLISLLTDRYGGKVQGNKFLNKGNNSLRDILTSIPQRANEYAKSEGTRTGGLGLIEEAFKGMLDTYTATSSIQGKQLEDLDKPRYMDNLFYTSVTDIIPGYMASMDRSLKVLVTGEDQEESAYSHYSGGFVDRSTLNKQHVKNALLDGTGDSLRNSVDSLLRQMGASDISLQAKRALRRHLMKDMAGANRFNPSRYVKIDTWRDEPEEIANELIEFFSTKFGLSASGEQMDDSEDIKTHRLDVAEKFSEVQSRLPEFGQRMNMLSGVTGRRVWRDLNLTRFNGSGGDIIDLDKVYDLIVNQGDDFDPKDEEKLKKSLDPEQYRQALVARRKKQEEKEAAIAKGANNDNVDVFKRGLNRNLGRSIVRPDGAGPGPTPGPANLPAVQAQIEWPEVMKARDEETHIRLDRLIGAASQNGDLLGLIAQLIPNAGAAIPRGDGGGPDGGPDGGGEGPGEDLEDSIQEQIDEIRRRWYDASIREGASGGAKKIGKGLVGAAKGFGKYLKWSYGSIFSVSKFGIKGAFGAAKLPFKALDGFGISDVHKAGEEEPTLLARDIRKGYYFDINSKKKVEKLKDITGPVKDVRTNEVVLTQEDIDQGLFSGTGESLAGFFSRAGLKAGALLAKGTKAYIGGTYGLMWKTAKFVGRHLLDQFTQFDAYLPGDTEPRIRSVLMKKGAYRTAEGTVITSLKDINGPVYEMDTDGNRTEIVSQKEIDQYKSFYTVNGSLLYTVGSKVLSGSGRALALAGQAAKWYGKKTIAFYKGIGKMVGAMGRGIKNFVMGRFKNGAVGMLDDEMALAAVEIGGQQLQVQMQILDFMKSRWDQEKVHGDTDGDGTRDWSWQDIIRRRKEKLAAKEGGAAAAAAGGSEAVVDAIQKMDKNLDEKLEELKETTEEAGESSMLENAADLSDIADSREGRKGRRGRGGRGGAGKKGFLRRAGGSIMEKGGKLLRKVPGGGMLARGGAWAARGALAAATWAAPMLLEGAVALGSVLSAPVVLGALAIGGAAYVGYRMYKASEAQKYPLLYLRMTQYGVNPTDEKRVNMMIQLEGIVRRGVNVSKDGQASIDPAKLELSSVLELFDASDADRRNQLFMWIQNRFKPIFLAHCSAMQKIRSTTDLTSVDDGIGDGDIETFLSTVDQAGMQKIYDTLDASPFDGSLTEDADDVASAIKMVRGRRKLGAEQKKMKMDNAVATGNVNAVAAAATVAVAANGSGDASQIAKGLIIQQSVRQGRLPTSVAGVAAGMKIQTSLDIPTAVRYKTYGLIEMKLDKCIQLQKVEEIYWPALTYVGTSKATLAGNMDDLENRAIDLFKPANEVQRADVQKWVRFRFIPTFLQYAISVRRRYNGEAKNAAASLTGTLMREVLDETTRAVATTPMGETSVWKIGNSPWPGEMLETMAGSTKTYIDALDKGDNAKVLDVKGMEAQKNQDPNDFGKTLTNIALGNQRANGSGTGVNQSAPTLSNYGKIYGQGQVAGGAKGQSTTGFGTGAMLMNGPSGTKVQHPGGGTGGDINALPNNTGKGIEAMGPIITAAAKMVGFDPGIALNVAAVESGLDPNASSGIAFGLFQFVKGTWGDMIRKYGSTYGIAPNTPMSDPRANAILGICYLKENYQGLTGPLGGNISDVDLYAAHFLGLGGAKRFLPAPGNESSGKYVSAAAIENNNSVFYGPNGLRTVAEVKQELDRRIQIGKKKAGMGAAQGPKGGVAVAAGGAGAPAFNTGGAVEDEGGGATTAGAAVTALDAANAANGGAAGTPSATQVTPRPPSAPMTADIATEVNGSAPPADAFGGAAVTPAADTGAAPAFVPPKVAAQPTASRDVAASTVAKNYEQQASSAESINSLLGKQLEIAQSMDGNIKQIRDAMLQLINRGGGAQASEPPPAPRQTEPARRAPVQTQRQQAVT